MATKQRADTPSLAGVGRTEGGRVVSAVGPDTRRESAHVRLSSDAA